MAFVLIPLLGITLWSFGFVHPQLIQANNTMPLFESVYQALVRFPWVSVLIAMLLVIGGGFLLNFIVNENEVLSKQSFLPAAFYIIFMSNNGALLVLHPSQFSNIFLMWALHKLMSSYRKDFAFSEVFDAGILISIASLFYFPCIVFLPVIGAALLLFRPFNWREWLISFFGVLIPYAFVFTYYFWNDSVRDLVYTKMFYPVMFKKPSMDMPQSFYFMLSVGWMIVLFSFGKLFTGLGSGAQKTKKSIILMIWLFIFSIGSVFLAPEISTKYFCSLAISTTVIVSNYFLRQKKELWGEILFALLFISICVNLISNIF